MPKTSFGDITGVPVYACALIGDAQGEGLVLLVRHEQEWVLPGAWVRPGERVEDALGRGVHDTTGLAVSETDLLTVAEDCDGLVFVFDVTTRPLSTALQPDLEWRPSAELQGLWPAGLQGRLDETPPTWLPRSPSRPSAAQDT